MKKIWSLIGANAEQIKILFGIIVALFVLVEYLDKQWDDRISRSLDYKSLRHRADTQAAHVNSQIFLQERGILDEKYVMEKYRQMFGQDQNQHEYDKALAALVEEKLRSADPQDASVQQQNYVHHLRDIYDAVAHCTLTEECDELTSCTSFFGEAQLFRRLYAKYFEDWDESLQLNSTYFIDEFIERCDKPVYFRWLSNNPWPFDKVRLYLDGLLAF